MKALIAFDGSHNINGPTVMRVPAWLPGRKAQYYLYFAHHKGDQLRMAYADQLQGPWKLYRPGVLHLAQSGFPQAPAAFSTGNALGYLWRHFSLPLMRDTLSMAWDAAVRDKRLREQRGVAAALTAKPHIASPELIIDHKARRVLMLYHGLDDFGIQTSRIAVSRDGLHFVPLAQQPALPAAYLRSFRYAGQHYLLGMPGVLLRAQALQGPFQVREQPLLPPSARHASVLRCNKVLHVFWSRVGDAPESILHSQMDLTPDWAQWRLSEPQPILRPELVWEGAELPLQASLRGESNQAARELRDPFVFRDHDGQLWLLYSGGGEQAIGLARLSLPVCEQEAPAESPRAASDTQLARVT